MHSLALKRPGVLVALLLLCSALAPPAEAGSRHRPDLVVESLSNPPTLAVPGARFVVAEVTANVGRERANASWTTYALTARQRWIALDGRRVPALKRGTRSDWQTTIVTRRVRGTACMR